MKLLDIHSYRHLERLTLPWPMGVGVVSSAANAQASIPLRAMNLESVSLAQTIVAAICERTEANEATLTTIPAQRQSS